MRDYDPSQPLIAIHIPKTGGTSVRQLYEEWFGDGFLTHYKQGKTLPPKHDLSSAHWGKAPTVVYGHFNKIRTFGIEAYYPEVKQFTTILRDPFERAVSRYFHLKRESIQEVDLRDALLNQLPEWSMLCHFPQAVTMENYEHIIETYFIEVGIAEHMEISLQRIAAKLGKKYIPLSSKRLNASQRDCRVPYELAAEFAKNHPLDYAVYNYALSKYT